MWLLLRLLADAGLIADDDDIATIIATANEYFDIARIFIFLFNYLTITQPLTASALLDVMAMCDVMGRVCGGK